MKKFLKGGIWQNIQDFRFSSIWFKYFVMLFLCLVLPTILSSIWYSRSMSEQLRHELVSQNEALLNQSYGNVESVLTTAKNLGFSLSNEQIVTSQIYRTAPFGDRKEDLEALQNMFSWVRKSNEFIDSIYVYFENTGEVVTETSVESLSYFRDRDAFADFGSQRGSAFIHITPRVKYNHYPYLLTVTCPVFSSSKAQKGMIAININVESMGDYIGSGQYRNMPYVTKLLIFDESMDTLVYSDDYRLLRDDTELDELKEAVGTWSGSLSCETRLWDRDYVIAGAESREDGLKFLYLTTTTTFEEESRRSISTLRNLMILITIVCVVLAYFLAQWVYRPIQKTLKQLSDTSMLTKWDEKEHLDEIEAIQRSLLSAKEERDNLDEEIQRRIVSLHNAQICALQMQIDPHFLYNTLEAIGNAAALMYPASSDGSSQKTNPVTESIYTLGRLMRISLSSRNYLVPLKEEMEHVELYMKLIEFRFNGRFSLIEEIPEDMKEERIPKLTLQPIIENSVLHGFSEKRKDCCLFIRGKREGDELFVFVDDNGTGMSQEARDELNEDLKKSAIADNEHIGLRNVNQRLQLIFGETYGLSLEPSAEGGLRVVVRFRTLPPSASVSAKT